MADFHLPGAGVAVVRGDEIVHAEGFGWADIAGKRPYTPEARHRVASVTKTMIALCVMSLVDEGKLSLDAKVTELLPDIELKGDGASSVTLWHLLTHTSGIGEAPNTSDIAKAFDKLFGESPPGVPLADLYDEGITVEAMPGTKWAYCNHGFALLGEIASRMDGLPLAEVMERRVFGPLGMESGDLLDQPHPDLTRGYTQAPTPEAWSLIRLLGIQLESETPEDGHNMPGKYVRVWGNGGAGAVQSTLLDMAKYASALLRSSRGVVRPETFAAMTSDQYRPDPRLPGWGLGFSVRDSGGHRHFGHGGAAFGGWNSYIACFPESDAALVFHVNVMSDEFDGVMVPRVIAAFVGSENGPLPDAAIGPLILESAPGVYQLTNPGPLTNFRAAFQCGRVQIAAADGEIVMHSQRGPWKNGAKLRLADAAQPDYYVIDKGGKVRQYMALLLDDDGRVTGLRFPQIVDMERNPDAQPWA